MIHGPLSQLLLDGRYRVGELIGSGGFGHVYAALHVGLEGKVAIKVPRIDDLPPRAIPEAIGKFLEEGRTLKRLRHPNLAAALDVALLPPDAEGLALPYLVLEWCDGPTLTDWLARRAGPMRASEAWAVLRPAFEALAHAHAAGVAHRDIKPRNILVETSPDGTPRPRLIDFGIAKLVGGGDTKSSGTTRTTSDERAYTPRYAAPEQVTGMRTGARTDVFAIALVLLEMIRGAPVFADDEDARRAVLESDLPTVRKLGLDLGSWNEHLDRALAARPRDRFPDAAAFLRALDGTDRVTGPATGLAPGAAIAQGTAPTARRRDGAPPGALAPRATVADDSVVPSSHTLRTTGYPAPGGDTRSGGVRSSWIAIALGGLAAAVLVVFVTLVLVPFGGLKAIQRMGFRTSSGASSNPGPPPEAIAGRPMASLTATEVADRARAAGMVDCKPAPEAEATTRLTCLEGEITITDHRDGSPPIPGRVWERTELEARQLAQGQGARAVRYAVGDEAGFVVAAPPSLVEGVAALVLDGIRHEGVMVAGPSTGAPIPARLVDWTGAELATRIRALGGVVQEDATTLNVTSVLYRLDGRDGFAMFQLIQPSAGDAFLASAPRPCAYAVDGHVAIFVGGTDELSTSTHLKKVLGTTTATRLAEHR